MGGEGGQSAWRSGRSVKRGYRRGHLPPLGWLSPSPPPPPPPSVNVFKAAPPPPGRPRPWNRRGGGGLSSGRGMWDGSAPWEGKPPLSGGGRAPDPPASTTPTSQSLAFTPPPLPCTRCRDRPQAYGRLCHPLDGWLLPLRPVIKWRAGGEGDGEGASELRVGGGWESAVGLPKGGRGAQLRPVRRVAPSKSPRQGGGKGERGIDHGQGWGGDFPSHETGRAVGRWGLRRGEGAAGGSLSKPPPMPRSRKNVNACPRDACPPPLPTTPRSDDGQKRTLCFPGH